MKDYLKPNLELSPNQVVLHVGTNDLKQKEPRHVADSIVNFARQIDNSCEGTSFKFIQVYSSLFTTSLWQVYYKVWNMKQMMYHYSQLATAIRGEQWFDA